LEINPGVYHSLSKPARRSAGAFIPTLAFFSMPAALAYWIRQHG
jgi:hypothetical protein